MEYQSGFREGFFRKQYSCETAIQIIINKIDSQ